MGEEKKESLADACERLAYLIIDAVPDKIKDEPLKETIIALATLIDKMRLLRGEATEVKETRQLDFSKLKKEELEQYVGLLGKVLDRSEFASGSNGTVAA